MATLYTDGVGNKRDAIGLLMGAASPLAVGVKTIAADGTGDVAKTTDSAGYTIETHGVFLTTDPTWVDSAGNVRVTVNAFEVAGPYIDAAGFRQEPTYVTVIGGAPVAPPANTVAPAIVGTLDDAQTLTLDYGTWTDADTLVVEYQRDGVTITTYNINDGDPDPTRAYSYAAEVGRALRLKVTATGPGGVSAPVYSPIRFGVYNSLVYSTGFDGPNGLFSAFDEAGEGGSTPDFVASGGTVTAQNFSQIFNNELVAYGNSGTTWERDAGGPRPRLRYTMARNTGDDTINSLRSIYTLWSSSANNMRLQVQSNQWALAQRLAGATTNLGSASITNPEGTTFEIIPVLSGGNTYIQVERNGVRVGDLAVNGGAGYGPVDASLTGFTKVAFTSIENINSYASLPMRAATHASIRVPQANVISPALSAPIQSPTNPEWQRTTVTGAYSGTVDALEYMAVDPDGVPITGWIAMGAIAGGSINQTIDIPYGGGGTGYIAFRDTSDPTTIVTQAINWIVLQSISPYVQLMNEGFITEATMNDSYMDGGNAVSLRVRTASTNNTYVHQRGKPADSIGIATSADGSGATQKMDWDGRFYPVSGSPGQIGNVIVCRNYYAEAGTYEIDFDPDNVVSGLSVSLASGAAISYSGGQKATFVVPSPGEFVGPSVIVLFAGMPVTGLKPQIKRSTDDGTKALRPTALANFQAVANAPRFMTERGINNAQNLETETPTNFGGFTEASRPRGRSNMGRETFVKACNEIGGGAWWNYTHLDQDDVITATAAYKASMLSSTVLSNFNCTEWSNEPWNEFMFQTDEIRLMGVRRGYAPSGVNTHAAAVPETIIDARLLVNPSTLVTSAAFNTNDRIYINNYGFGSLMLRARQNVAAGVTIPDSGTVGNLDANWECVYNNSDIMRAGWRMVGRRTKEIHLIEKAEYEALGKPVPKVVVNAQAVGTFSTSVQIALDFDSVHEIVDYVAIAPYIADALGRFRTTTGAWNEAVKTQAYHTMATAVAAVEAELPAQVTACTNTIAAYRISLGNYCYAKFGKTGVNRIKLAVYEFNQHSTFTDWPCQCGIWNALTGYVTGAFALGSDGQTYRANMATTGNDPVSSPTQWTVYTDGQGQLWDEPWSTAIRANPRPVVTLMNTFRKGAAMADAIGDVLDFWIANVGGPFSAFDRTGYKDAWSPSATGATGDVVSWTFQDNELDNAVSGGGLNRRWKALVDRKP